MLARHGVDRARDVALITAWRHTRRNETDVRVSAARQNARASGVASHAQRTRRESIHSYAQLRNIQLSQLRNIQLSQLSISVGDVNDDVTTRARYCVNVTRNTHPVRLGAAAAWVDPGGCGQRTTAE